MQGKMTHTYENVVIKQLFCMLTTKIKKHQKTTNPATNKELKVLYLSHS